MASFLRQIVAGPRLRHPEAGLDLCYVTDNIIATSGPSSTYPQRAYRNPTEALVKFLDYKHGERWAIWEFRAEGTGYPDSEVYNRIRHYPWPDHHPPPFALIPHIMASMRDWLKGPGAEKERVIVVHCKAGKGRSGTVATSYLISEEGWSVEDAMLRFTARRMRNGFGAGISIPSQVRWVGYTDWWTKHGKIYVERQIEIVEVHVWGLKNGVKVAIEGYVEQGKAIKTFHTFSRHEKTIRDNTPSEATSPSVKSQTSTGQSFPMKESKPCANDPDASTTSVSISTKAGQVDTSHKPSTAAVLFRPAQPLILPSSDVKVDFERRNKAKYGLTMVTSVAHVWFNAFFEAHYASQQPISNSAATPDDIKPQVLDPTSAPSSGVFSIHWDAMDGVKGSARKGTRALDRLSLIWRAVTSTTDDSATNSRGPLKIITQPASGQPIPDTGPSKPNDPLYLSPETSSKAKDLGLRRGTPQSENVSQASSPASAGGQGAEDDDSPIGVKAHRPNGEEVVEYPNVDQNQNNVMLVGLQDQMQPVDLKHLPKSEQKIPGQILPGSSKD